MLLLRCSTSARGRRRCGAPQAEAGAGLAGRRGDVHRRHGAEVIVDNPQRVVACMQASFASVGAHGRHAHALPDDAFTLSDYDLVSPDVQKVKTSPAPTEAIIASSLTSNHQRRAARAAARATRARPTLKAALAAPNIPVSVLPVTRRSPITRRMLRTCCDITGRDDLHADRTPGQPPNRIAAITARCPGGADGPSCLPRSRAWRARAGVLHDDWLDAGRARRQEPGRREPEPAQGLQPESIIEMNPDFIFVVPMGNDDAAA